MPYHNYVYGFTSPPFVYTIAIGAVCILRCICLWTCIITEKNTTSVIFNKDETMLMKMIDSNNDNLPQACSVFHSMGVNPENVAETGLKLPILLYG